MAAEKGMIICVSAGNMGSRAWKYIGIPADATNVLSVGGIDIHGKRTPFSSYGYNINERVKPDACTVAKDVQVANAYGKTTKMDGTSFASPLLAGMVACLWQSCHEKTAIEVINAVQQSCDQYDKPDSSLGYGRVDMFKAYNLLKYPATITDASGNRLISVSLNSFVLNNKPLILTIEAAQATSINLQFQTEWQEPLPAKTYKIKAGKKIIKIKKYPKLRGQDYDFTTLKISGEGIDYQYLLGIDDN
jgi:subtilisin family serine protease